MACSRLSISASHIFPGNVRVDGYSYCFMQKRNYITACGETKEASRENVTISRIFSVPTRQDCELLQLTLRFTSDRISMMNERLDTSLNLRLDTSRKQKLDRLAEQYDITAGQLVRSYIDALLDMSPAEIREVIGHGHSLADFGGAFENFAEQLKILGQKVEAIEKRQHDKSLAKNVKFGGRYPKNEEMKVEKGS